MHAFLLNLSFMYHSNFCVRAEQMIYVRWCLDIGFVRRAFVAQMWFLLPLIYISTYFVGEAMFSGESRIFGE